MYPKSILRSGLYLILRSLVHYEANLKSKSVSSFNIICQADGSGGKQMVLVVPVAESDSIRGINIICQADGGDCNEDIGTLRDLERCLELIWPVSYKKTSNTFRRLKMSRKYRCGWGSARTPLDEGLTAPISAPLAEFR